MRIGLIGLGNMGRPMAQRIYEAGFSLIVHDARRTAGEELVGQGASWADSPRELAAECDVPMQLAELCAAEMARAMERRLGDQDNTVFLTLPGRLDLLHPGLDVSAGGPPDGFIEGLAVAVLQTGDLSQTAAYLSEQRIPLQQRAGGVRIGPAETCGVIFEFEE